MTTSKAPAPADRPRSSARGRAHRVPPPGLATDEAVRNAPVGAVYGLLGSRPEGLTAREAAERSRRDGPNALGEAHRPALVRRLVANFTHFMALLLWLGAGIAVVAGLPQLPW